MDPDIASFRSSKLPVASTRCYSGVQTMQIVDLLLTALIYSRKFLELSAEVSYFFWRCINSRAFQQ